MCGLLIFRRWLSIADIHETGLVYTNIRFLMGRIDVNHIDRGREVVNWERGEKCLSFVLCPRTSDHEVFNWPVFAKLVLQRNCTKKLNKVNLFIILRTRKPCKKFFFSAQLEILKYIYVVCVAESTCRCQSSVKKSCSSSSTRFSVST